MFTSTSVRPARLPFIDALLDADDFVLRGPAGEAFICRWTADNRDRLTPNEFEVLWPRLAERQTGTFDSCTDSFDLREPFAFRCTIDSVFKAGKFWFWNRPSVSAVSEDQEVLAA